MLLHSMETILHPGYQCSFVLHCVIDIKFNIKLNIADSEGGWQEESL